MSILALKRWLKKRLFPTPKPIQVEVAEPKVEQHQQPNQAEIAVSDPEIFLTADDPRNPLHLFSLPIPMAIKRLADQLLEDGQQLTAHQKVVRFMNFLNDFKVGVPSNSELTTVLQERKGACGEFVNLTAALAATQNIASRIIVLHNYPPQNGHVVAEFLIEGKWQLYDPTYASHYTITPEDRVHPTVFSFNELRAGRGRCPDATCVVGNQVRLEVGRNGRSYDFLGPLIYEKAEPAGPIGTENPLIFPLTMDLKAKSQIDRSSDSFALKYQGANHLGSAYSCAMQKWTLTSLNVLQEYEFVLTPGFIGGDPPIDEFRVQALVLSGGRVEEDGEFCWKPDQKPLTAWHIKFAAHQQEVVLLLTHSYRGPKRKYITMESYSLREADSADQLTQQ